MDRTKLLGSSEVAAALGLSRWKTALQLWGEKTGELPSADLSGNEAAEWGTRLEDVVAKKFAEKNSCKLIAYKKRFSHKTHPWLSCELDRIISGTDELVEVKTCSTYKLKEWSEADSIPQEYIIQVMVALGLSGRKVGHIAVLVGGQKYLEKKITFDQEMYDGIVAKCCDFWYNYVEKKVPPMTVGADNEIMVDLYPGNRTDEMVQATEETNDSIALLQETKGHIDELVKQKDDLEARLKAIIGDKSGLITDKYKVTWKSQGGAPRYLSEAMKADGVFDKYAEPTTKRVLRVALKKEGKNE